jgi:hypothetical protein
VSAAEHDEIVRSSSHVSSSKRDVIRVLEVAAVYEIVRMHKYDHSLKNGF